LELAARSHVNDAFDQSAPMEAENRTASIEVGNDGLFRDALFIKFAAIGGGFVFFLIYKLVNKLREGAQGGTL
jgi:hypothetical protein